MKRVISTKVDQATYAEFLQHCAKVNKYPANVLEDALDLLLRFEDIEEGYKRRIADLEEKLRKNPRTIVQEVELGAECPECHRDIGISNLKEFKCPYCLMELARNSDNLKAAKLKPKTEKSEVDEDEVELD